MAQRQSKPGVQPVTAGDQARSNHRTPEEEELSRLADALFFESESKKKKKGACIKGGSLRVKKEKEGTYKARISRRSGIPLATYSPAGLELVNRENGERKNQQRRVGNEKVRGPFGQTSREEKGLESSIRAVDPIVWSVEGFSTFGGKSGTKKDRAKTEYGGLFKRKKHRSWTEARASDDAQVLGGGECCLQKRGKGGGCGRRTKESWDGKEARLRK